MTIRSDFPRKISGEISCVTFLQFWALPVFARKNFAAIRRAAFAFNGVIVVVGRRPIVGEFLAGGGVPLEGDARTTDDVEASETAVAQPALGVTEALARDPLLVRGKLVG